MADKTDKADTADKIAKIKACPDQAALEGFLVEGIQDLPVPYSQLKNLVNKVILHLWMTSGRERAEMTGD